MPDDTLTQSIQESIVTALVFITDDNTRILSAILESIWFDEPYREIVSRSLSFWKDYKRAPEESHADDLFDDVLNNPDHKLHYSYSRILRSMHALRSGLKTEYLRGRVVTFARRQRLRSVVHDAAQILLERNASDEDFDRVEQLFSGVMNFQAATTDLGFRLSNVQRSLEFLDPDREQEALPLGIDELDRNGIHPRKGEVLLFLAPVNRGKSMFLHHVGKAGMNRGWRTLHLTLENSAVSTAQRYIQAQFSLGKAAEMPKLTRFDREEGGRLVGLYSEPNYAQPMYPDDEDRYRANEKLRDTLTFKIKGGNEYRYNNLWIGAFGTGELTFAKYEAYLDQLQFIENFSPELVIIDYPWLMDFQTRNDSIRTAYGKLAQYLRGSAVKRRYALAVVSQLNQKGGIAEDYSQLWTCDNAIKFNQTEQEFALGLARLYVEKARNDRAYFTVLISQNYAASTFCVDSAMMIGSNRYKQILEAATPVTDTPAVTADDEDE